MSNAIPGQGVILKRGDGAGPEVFTAVAEIKSWSLSQSRAERNPTHITSTNVESKPGLLDPGELKISGNLLPDDTTHTALRTDFENGVAARNWQLILTDATPSTLAITAWVKSLEISGEVDGDVPFSATLRLTAKPTWS
jgi:predicted secreted protein